jgi:hypothetical protein
MNKGEHAGSSLQLLTCSFSDFRQSPYRSINSSLPFPQKPAAFYSEARLLFKIAGGLLKFTRYAFSESTPPFGVLLEKRLFCIFVFEK